MNYAAIKKTDIANGDGVRVSLWVSGCPIQCPGCFNKDLWDPNYGKPFTRETLNEITEALKPDYISGLTILGGEPLSPENRDAVADIAWWVRYMFEDRKTIWIYTGYNFEDIEDLEAVMYSDIIVDGPFIESKKDISLRFRGSSNQRFNKGGIEVYE